MPIDLTTQTGGVSELNARWDVRWIRSDSGWADGETDIQGVTAKVAFSPQRTFKRLSIRRLQELIGVKSGRLVIRIPRKLPTEPDPPGDLPIHPLLRPWLAAKVKINGLPCGTFYESYTPWQTHDYPELYENYELRDGAVAPPYHSVIVLACKIHHTVFKQVLASILAEQAAQDESGAVSEVSTTSGGFHTPVPAASTTQRDTKTLAAMQTTAKRTRRRPPYMRDLRILGAMRTYPTSGRYTRRQRHPYIRDLRTHAGFHITTGERRRLWKVIAKERREGSQ